MKKDRVCGAELDVHAATAAMKYRDQYYYFCSLRCRDAFAESPERFLSVGRPRSGGAERPGKPGKTAPTQL